MTCSAVWLSDNATGGNAYLAKDLPSTDAGTATLPYNTLFYYFIKNVKILSKHTKK